jgi:hypothetical protein
VVSGLFYNFYSVDKLVTDETKKIKIASDATSNLIDMVVADIPDCVQEYKLNGNMQYGEVNYTKVNNWAFKGLKLCSTQHLSSGFNFIKASWELSYVPLSMTVPYELIKNLVEDADPKDCAQAIQQLTYICPDYIINHVINKPTH